MFSGIMQCATSLFTREPPPKKPQVAPARNHASCTKTPDENFKAMELTHKHLFIADDGFWYSSETRQCRYTGIILKQTRRISE